MRNEGRNLIFSKGISIHRQGRTVGKSQRMLCSVVLLLGLCGPVGAIEIVVDYTYDTQNFFRDPVRREAIEAAAARYSRIITSTLLESTPAAGDVWRIGFEHPGTGEPYQLSTAGNALSDPIAPSVAADEYGFDGLAEDELRLFVGGRQLASAGKGGTATGTNFTDLFDDLEGPLRRGVISNTPDDTVGDLPAWGGAVTFDIDRNWHFDLDTASSGFEVDFYSIALHEIGHVLGMSTTWNQWQQHVTGNYYTGPAVLETYNEEHNTSLTRLNLVSNIDPHWVDSTYTSAIFAPGDPVMVGTINGRMQDLLLDPVTNFDNQIRRLELTRVDVAALQDVGWSVVDPLDINSDGRVDLYDVNVACAGGDELGEWFEALGAVRSDLDFNGVVDFNDFLQLSRNFNTEGVYTSGDVTCDGLIEFGDFITLSGDFGNRAGTQIASVPEPRATFSLMIAIALFAVCRPRVRTTPGR